MGTHPIFESDFDCLTESIIYLMKLITSFACFAQFAISEVAQYASLMFEDGARVATGNRGMYGNSKDLLYRDNAGNKGDLPGLILDTKAGGESAGLFFNGNGMTMWNPADHQALHFVDQDNSATSAWWISQSGNKHQTSDETRKREIEEYDPPDLLEKFKQINLVTYKKKCRTEKCRNKNRPREFGIIAQEAEKLGIMDLLIENYSNDPDYVDDGKSSRYFVDYEKMNVILLRAVQKMTAEMESKEAMIKSLEENNNKIEN